MPTTDAQHPRFSDTSRATPDPDVISTLLDDETVLLHMGTQHYYTLNETGSFIWQRLERGCSIGEIRSDLEQHYEVSSEQATQSISELLQDLCAEHLLSLADTPLTDEPNTNT